MIDTILFDLDGTLLPMDQDIFVKEYMTLLSGKLAGYGYEPRRLVKSIWAGTEAMVRNDGTQTNEQVFWRAFRQIYGPGVMDDLPLFEEFYAGEFGQVRKVCGYTPLAAELIGMLKEKGYRLILATNPIFPEVATRQRIRWAGLSPEDFELVTTYENSRHCKPNADYYRDIMALAEVKPEQCMMVGNDVGEDMVAKRLGMQEFLLTDCLINKSDADISAYRHGSMEALVGYARENL